MDLIVKPTTVLKSETVSLEDTKDRSIKDYKAPKVNLSNNIQAFDDRVKKVHTKNPTDYNTIALDENKGVVTTPTSFQMITNPEYNTIGKFLGVDTVHEWSKDYDKVYEIVKWAKSKSGAESTNELVQWLNGAFNFIPALSTNHRKIDQLFLYSKIQGVN